MATVIPFIFIVFSASFRFSRLDPWPSFVLAFWRQEGAAPVASRTSHRCQIRSTTQVARHTRRPGTVIQQSGTRMDRGVAQHCCMTNRCLSLLVARARERHPSAEVYEYAGDPATMRFAGGGHTLSPILTSLARSPLHQAPTKKGV